MHFKAEIIMYLTKIDLENFRAAKHLSFNFHPKMNLLVGVNGAGKSTVLHAIKYALIPLLKSIDNSTTNRNSIHSSDISTSRDSASIRINVNFNRKEYSWSISKVRPGSNSAAESIANGYLNLSRDIKSAFKKLDSLPLIVYYPVNRIVETIVPIIDHRNAIEHDSLDVYDNALEGKSNFHNFFKWFRQQDDLVNQKYSSRSHWIKRKMPELRSRVFRIFDNLSELYPSDDSSFLHGSKMHMKDFEFMLHEPSFLFREMGYTIRSNEQDWKVFSDFFHNLDYAFHKMDMLSDDGFNYDKGSKDELFYLLSDITKNFSETFLNSPSSHKFSSIMLSIITLSIEIGLWWISDEAHSNLTKILSRLTSKYSEIDVLSADEFREKYLKPVERIIEKDLRKRSSAKNNYGRDLEYVTQAIEMFIPEYSNLRINRGERGLAQMLVEKNGDTFDIAQLSDGEKNLIALIGDIARRLTIGNPNSKNPLHESGIILIDELDLHLHPKWQRIVAKKLPDVFPHCQFIVTSHSPQVISHVKPESVLTLSNIDGEIVKGYVSDSYGKNSDRILEDVMDETARPHDVDHKIKEIFSLIQEGNISGAQNMINDLRQEIGEDGDLVKANVLIKRREIIGK